MLCQSCGKHEAEFHYKSNINGSVTELHLCADCAKKQGYAGAFGVSTGDYISNMLSGFFGAPALSPRTGGRRCSVCGATAHDIEESGLVGCAGCYDEFADMLEPYIRRIHGSAQNSGKVPDAAGAELKAKRELGELKQRLKAAVEAQEFEQAAQLRDKINELEKGDEQK